MRYRVNISNSTILSASIRKVILMSLRNLTTNNAIHMGFLSPVIFRRWALVTGFADKAASNLLRDKNVS